MSDDRELLFEAFGNTVRRLRDGTRPCHGCSGLIDVLEFDTSSGEYTLLDLCRQCLAGFLGLRSY